MMNPYSALKNVLILDNCSIHHVEGVKEMCTAWYVSNTYLVILYKLEVLVVSNLYICLHTHQISTQLRSALPLSSSISDIEGRSFETV